MRCCALPKLSAQILNAAVESRFWPLYEVVDGRYRLTYEPKKPAPIEDWLRPQKRFAHLLRPENRELLEQVRRRVADDWAALVARTGLRV